MQVKERLALTKRQAEAYESAAEALRSLEGQHEQSASAGAQALKQVVSLLRPYTPAPARSLMGSPPVQAVQMRFSMRQCILSALDLS